MKRYIAIGFITLSITGCLANNWNEKEKNNVLNQNINLIKLYTSKQTGIKALQEPSTQEEIDVAKCSLNKIINNYSYSEYFKNLSNGKHDKRTGVIKLNKFRIDSFIDCNIKFSGNGYMTLASQGYIKVGDIPKNKLKEFFNKK